MSDTSHAKPPAEDAADPVDDGFDTPEERAAFEEMRQATPDPGADAGGAPPPEDASAGDAPPAGGAAPPAAGDAPGPDDEEEDEGEEVPAIGADGKPAVGADGKPAHRPKKRVTLNKYLKVEERAKAAEEKLAAGAAREARLDERLKIINEAIAPRPETAKTAAEADPEPDKEADLFGWLDWKGRQDTKRDKELSDLRAERQAEVEERNLATAYEEDATAFVREEPNFGPAYQFLMNNRVFELAQYYFNKDLSEPGMKVTVDEIRKIQATISAEERELVKQAIANDQRPAERMYKLAKARGYRPQAPAADGAAAAPANGKNGKAAAIPGSLAESPGVISVTDEIARIKAGTEASKSLSGGGGAPASPLTAKQLADMPQEEFDHMMETLPAEKLRELMGN